MSQKKGLTSTHNYVKPKEFCDFNNHILCYSPVFEVFKMGHNIFAGQGTEFIKPDMVECWSQPLFLTHPLFNYIYFLYLVTFAFWTPQTRKLSIIQADTWLTLLFCLDHVALFGSRKFSVYKPKLKGEHF